MQNTDRPCSWDLRAIKFMDTVIDGLTMLAHLEELQIDFAGYPFTELNERSSPEIIPFHRFRHLRSIAIGGANLPATYAAECVQQIHAFVKGGGELTSLALALPASNNLAQPTPPLVLHEIYHNVPRTSFPALRNLRLSGYSLQLDVATVLLLRGLTALDIAHATDIHVSGVDSALWRGLQAGGIRLKELVVQAITAPLLHYLSSYMGLEQLTAHGGRYTRVRLDWAAEQRAINEAQRLSHELCCRVLPLHSGSLVAYKGINTVTTLAPSYMTYESMLGLATCMNLESVAFALHATDLNEEYRTGELVRTSRDEMCLHTCAYLSMLPCNLSPEKNYLSGASAPARIDYPAGTFDYRQAAAGAGLLWGRPAPVPRNGDVRKEIIDFASNTLSSGSARC